MEFSAQQIADILEGVIEGNSDSKLIDLQRLKRVLLAALHS